MTTEYTTDPRKGRHGGICADPDCDDAARWIPVAHKIRDTGQYYCEAHCEQISSDPSNWNTTADRS